MKIMMKTKIKIRIKKNLGLKILEKSADWEVHSGGSGGISAK
jgi:hypothetical protein